jgi:hypothetical protein
MTEPEPARWPDVTDVTDVTEPPRRGPDLPMLLIGLVSTAAAVLTLVGWMPDPPTFDGRWLLAGGAVLVGLLLLAASNWSNRDR